MSGKTSVAEVIWDSSKQGATEFVRVRDLVLRMLEEYGAVPTRKPPALIATGGVVADRIRGVLSCGVARRWEFTKAKSWAESSSAGTGGKAARSEDDDDDVEMSDARRVTSMAMSATAQ